MELGVAATREDGDGRIPGNATGITRGLSARLAAVTALRLAFLTLLLVATAFFYLRGDFARYPASLRIVLGTIAGAYALAGVYAVLLRAGRRLEVVASTQIVLDQLTWSAIVYVSGGATSGATSFYALTCLVGAILIGRRGAALAAVTGLTAYGALCAGFVERWIRPPVDQDAAAYAIEWAQVVYPLMVNVLGIVVVAVLAGYLAERLRITGGALEAAMRRALDAERLAVLGRVAAGLAHEIRNPLGSISGSIEMLRESPALSDEDRHLCDIVRREAARLNALVSDMVDLSRPRPPRVEVVDVAALARDVVALAARSDRSGAGDVQVRYEGPDAEALARCDGAQMRQVLWNLVRNAVQASGAGSSVCVRVSPGPRVVELAVEDHGPGIPAGARSQIYEAFFTTRSQGAGIGLAVVKRIIEDHAAYGASIHVESPHVGGAGAAFRVRLSRAGGAGAQ
jgi:two-component system sensor histidine kinase HydH